MNHECGKNQSGPRLSEAAARRTPRELGNRDNVSRFLHAAGSEIRRPLRKLELCRIRVYPCSFVVEEIP
jgi:hypothetical protein